MSTTCIGMDINKGLKCENGLVICEHCALQLIDEETALKLVLEEWLEEYNS
jgi:hypothetical protein